MGTETREEVFENAAGLLARLGFVARVRVGYKPAGEHAPVTALITDASPVLVGYAVTSVAGEPEAHLPEVSAWAGKSPAGDKLLAWF